MLIPSRQVTVLPNPNFVFKNHKPFIGGQSHLNKKIGGDSIAFVFSLPSRAGNRYDRGEFENYGFEIFCNENGFSHNFSALRTPNKMGLLKGKRRNSVITVSRSTWKTKTNQWSRHQSFFV